MVIDGTCQDWMNTFMNIFWHFFGPGNVHLQNMSGLGTFFQSRIQRVSTLQATEAYARLTIYHARTNELLCDAITGRESELVPALVVKVPCDHEDFWLFING